MRERDPGRACASFRSRMAPCSRPRSPATRRRTPSSRTRCSTTSASPRHRCTRACACAGLLPPGRASSRRYRRVPVATAADEDDEAVLAAVQVPIAGVFELDSASTRLARWLVAPWSRRFPRTAPLLQAGSSCASGSSTGSEREHGSIELIKKLLDGIGDAFYAYAARISTRPRGASRRSSSRARPR